MTSCVDVQLNWLSVDFNNWKDWEDDSDEDMSNFDRFSEVWEDEYLEVWASFWALCRHAGADSWRKSHLPRPSSSRHRLCWFAGAELSPALMPVVGCRHSGEMSSLCLPSDMK